MPTLRWLPVLLLCCAANATAQDAWTVTGQEQTPIYQNNWVRVRRVIHRPGETSAMHDHLDRIAVRLTDFHSRATFSDGSKKESTAKAREAIYSPSTRHSVENLGDTTYEAISIEFKSPVK